MTGTGCRKESAKRSLQTETDLSGNKSEKGILYLKRPIIRLLFALYKYLQLFFIDCSFLSTVSFNAAKQFKINIIA